MKRILACIAVVAFIAAGAQGRSRGQEKQARQNRRQAYARRSEKTAKLFQLTLHPSKTAQAGKKYSLLPQQSTEDDAVKLYQRAVQLLPGDIHSEQIQQWLHTPLSELDVKQVQPVLEQFKSTVEAVDKAVRCKHCNWPPAVAGKYTFNLSEFRHIARILTLRARVQMAQGRYDEALVSIQTALAMGRQIGQSPVLIQGLVATAISTLSLNQVNEFIQGPSAPNLYEALKELPKPFIDLNKPIEAELATLRASKQYNATVRNTMEQQLKPAHEKVRSLMNRLDRQIAALACIEALRLYAGRRNGKFPSSLEQLKTFAIPDDPVTKKPFRYSLSGSRAAVLSGPAPKGAGASAREAVRYELTLN